MLREQLLGFAIKTLTHAFETKERLKNNYNQTVGSYVRSMKSTALGIMEYQWQKLRTSGGAYGTNVLQKRSTNGVMNGHKKPRKSSIKPAKEIGSLRADLVLAKLTADKARLVKKDEAIDGKTTLAYLVWALGHAERAQLNDGISVHDVSALLYRACSIELYPINISRVVYGNANLVRQAGQQKRTKTYLLTSAGMDIFKRQFI